jgi:hypothetical protein
MNSSFEKVSLCLSLLIIFNHRVNHFSSWFRIQPQDRSKRVRCRWSPFKKLYSMWLCDFLLNHAHYNSDVACCCMATITVLTMRDDKIRQINTPCWNLLASKRQEQIEPPHSLITTPKLRVWTAAEINGDTHGYVAILHSLHSLKYPHLHWSVTPQVSLIEGRRGLIAG